MQVSSGALDDEVRITVESAAAIANAVRADEDAAALHSLLIDYGFQMAIGVSQDEIDDAYRSLVWLSGLIDMLPEADLATAVEAVNRALASRAVAPSVSAHNGLPLHIHWTQASVPLGGRVVVDVLMAVAQTLCDDGVDRFGRCQADGCESVYYDATKNRSKRFCNDPRCASRTHTANHRARSRAGERPT